MFFHKTDSVIAQNVNFVEKHANKIKVLSVFQATRWALNVSGWNKYMEKSPLCNYKNNIRSKDETLQKGSSNLGTSLRSSYCDLIGFALQQVLSLSLYAVLCLVRTSEVYVAG